MCGAMNQECKRKRDKNIAKIYQPIVEIDDKIAKEKINRMKHFRYSIETCE